MADALTLTVVTPEASVVEGIQSPEVALPAEAGQIGVLPGHTPLVALLGVGLVEWREGGRKRAVAVRGGFVEIANDAVRVLADRAATPESSDTAGAARDKEAAEARRMDVVGDEQLAEVNGDVAFAEARLRVAEKS